MPDYKEAKRYFKFASRDLKTGFTEKDPEDRLIMVSSAFNKLFHAARTAVQIYLATDETRWGKLKQELPKPFKIKFNDIINVCHVQYGYDKRLPAKDNDVKLEFVKWEKIVQDFIRELEERIEG